MEIWKDIPGYEGRYQVSNLGRVKSLARRVNSRSLKCRILKYGLAGIGGYPFVNLCNGHTKGFMIHRLVLEAFVGPCPEGGQCRHLDGNPENNQLGNLRWGTSKQNGEDRIGHGTSSKCKLTELQVKQARDMCGELYTQKDVARRIGVSPYVLRKKIPEVSWKRGGSHGSKHWMAKLTESDIPVIRKKLSLCIPIRVIAREYGVDPGVIHGIKHRRGWAHVA